MSLSWVIIVILVLILVGVLIWALWETFHKSGNSLADDWDQLKEDAASKWDDLKDNFDDNQANGNGGQWNNGTRGGRRQRGSRSRPANKQQIEQTLDDMNMELSRIGGDCLQSDQAGKLQDMLQNGRSYLQQIRQQCSGSDLSPSFDCDDYDYRGGDYCWQETPNGKECFQHGGMSDGSAGWYNKVDSSMCEGRPDCGAVMKACSGYDPTDF